jgi:hypothetical protein
MVMLVFRLHPKRGLTMKNALQILLMMCLGLALAGCAGMNPVPDGSQPVGNYQGQVQGGMNGSIQLTLFQTPAGDTAFSGQLVDAANGAVSNFEGTVIGNSLNGKIGLVLGTIDGQLSADGSRMSGSLKFAQFNATWSASPQF